MTSTCVWCEDEELAMSLMERMISSGGELSEEEYQKMIPDLVLCYDCVMAYHRVKLKFNLTPKQIQDLVSDEETRTLYFISQLSRNLDPEELKTSPCYRELLSYPYLLMREKIFGAFSMEMDKLIQQPTDHIIEDELVPGIFFFLFSKYKKLRTWARTWIELSDPIDNGNFYMYNTIFTVIMKIFIQEYYKNPHAANEDVFSLDESTILPSFLYKHVDKNGLLSIISVCFKCMQTRVLKRLLMEESNKDFFQILLTSMKSQNCALKGELPLLQVLLEKLLTSFWLLPSDLNTPEELFHVVTNQPIYQRSLQTYMTGNKEERNLLGIGMMTSWIAPFLKSTSIFDFKDIFEKVLTFISSILKSCPANSHLFDVVADLFVVIFLDICTVDTLDYFADKGTEYSNVLFLIAKHDKQQRIKVRDSLQQLLQELLSQGVRKNILNNSTATNFEASLALLNSKAAVDMPSLRNTVSFIISRCRKVKLENIKSEPSEEASLQMNMADQLTAQLAGDTQDQPIVLSDDEDMEDYESSLGPRKLPVDENVEDEASVVMSPDAFNTESPVKANFITESPVKSNVNTEELAKSNQKPIDFDVSTTIHITSNADGSPSPIKRRQSEFVEAPVSKKIRIEHSKEKGPDSNQKSKPSLPSPKPLQLHIKNRNLPAMTTKKIYTLNTFFSSILSWKVSSLEEDMKEELLDHQLQSVPCSFETYDEYMRTFWALLLLEIWAQIRKEWAERHGCKKVSFIINTIEPFEMGKSLGELECCHFYETEVNEYMFFTNDLVVIEFSDTVKMFALVDECNRSNKARTDLNGKHCRQYSLRLKVRDISPALSKRDVTVTRVTSLITAIRQWMGMIGFRSSLLARDILKPFRENTYKIDSTHTVDTSKLKLNKQQLCAFNNVMKAVNNNSFVIPRICLLQGPPGTGKSYTVKTIITNLLQNRKKSTEKFRILVCAPSNAAIDQIALRLMNSPPRNQTASRESSPVGNCGDFNLIRIGNTQVVNTEVYRKHSLEALVKKDIRNLRVKNDTRAIKISIDNMSRSLDHLDHECVKLRMAKEIEKRALHRTKLDERGKLQQKIDILQKRLKDISTSGCDYRNEERKIKEGILRSADIICCTLSGAGSKDMTDVFKVKTTLRNEPPFSCVIIDEAGQCVEPDALIPLQYGSSKLVLVGDPAQLPATVLSKKASRCDFGQSLFERIVRSFGNEPQRYAIEILSSDTRPAVMLEEQYRMLPEICAFPSHRFYYDKLRYHGAKNSVSTLPLRQYVLLDVAGSKEEVDTSGSKHNKLEGEHVIRICEELVERKIVSAINIGVITPYSSQREMLRKELRRKCLNVFVQTIDGYQGQEREVIILSTVLAKCRRGDVGFLINPQRMNVALTRAKQSLIILANCETLQVDKDWEELVENAKSRSLYFRVNSTTESLNSIFVSQMLRLTDLRGTEKNPADPRKTKANQMKNNNQATNDESSFSQRMHTADSKEQPKASFVEKPAGSNTIPSKQVEAKKSIKNTSISVKPHDKIVQKNMVNNKSNVSSEAVTKNKLCEPKAPKENVSVQSSSLGQKVQINQDKSSVKPVTNQAPKVDDVNDLNSMAEYLLEAPFTNSTSQVIESRKKKLQFQNEKLEKVKVLLQKTQSNSKKATPVQNALAASIVSTASIATTNTVTTIPTTSVELITTTHPTTNVPNSSAATNATANLPNNDDDSDIALLKQKLLKKVLDAESKEQIAELCSTYSHKWGLLNNRGTTTNTVNAESKRMSKAVVSSAESSHTEKDLQSEKVTDSATVRVTDVHKTKSIEETPVRKETNCLREEQLPGKSTSREQNKPAPLNNQARLTRTLSDSSSNATSPLLDISPRSLNDGSKRRPLPSQSYYKLPHRHADGLFCESHCIRLVDRETQRRKTALTKTHSAPVNYANTPEPTVEKSPSNLGGSNTRTNESTSQNNVEPQLVETNVQDVPMQDTENSNQVAPSQKSHFPDERKPIVREADAMELSTTLDTPITLNEPVVNNIALPFSSTEVINKPCTFSSSNIPASSFPLFSNETSINHVYSHATMMENIMRTNPNSKFMQQAPPSLYFQNNSNPERSFTEYAQQLTGGDFEYLKNYARGFTICLLTNQNKVIPQTTITEEEAWKAINKLQRTENEAIMSGDLPDELKFLSNDCLIALLKLLVHQTDNQSNNTLDQQANNILDTNEWKLDGTFEDVTPPSSPGSHISTKNFRAVPNESDMKRSVDGVPSGVCMIDDALNEGVVNINTRPLTQVSKTSGPRGAGFMLTKIRSGSCETETSNNHKDRQDEVRDYNTSTYSRNERYSTSSRRHSPKLPRQRKYGSSSSSGSSTTSTHRSRDPQLPTQHSRKRRSPGSEHRHQRRR